MEETIGLSEVVQKYEETFEKLTNLKSGKSTEESNKIQDKYKKYLKAFPIKLDNGDVFYFDVVNTKVEVKYKSGSTGAIFVVDRLNINKFNKIQIDKIKVPDYIFKDIFEDEEKLDEDLESIKDTFEFFSTYEQTIDTVIDPTNEDLIAINESSSKISDFIQIISEKLKEEKKEYKKNKNLYNKKDKLYNKYKQLVIEKKYLKYITDCALKISLPLQTATVFAFTLSIPILLILPVDSIYVERWISFIFLQALAFPITSTLISPFILPEKKLLKKKYNSGEISEDTIMELKKKIEKSESNINQLEKLLDELHDTKIKLFKAKVEKEYNIQLEKQERNEQYQSINESYGLASDFNYAYAQNQSLALTNNRRY